MRVLRPLANWPAGLAALLAQQHDGTPAAWFEGEFRAGRLSLLEVAWGAAWVLWRRELRPDGQAELVLVAAVARPSSPSLIDAASPSLTRRYLPELEAFARLHRCASIRLHTARPGLIELALAAGWHQREAVMACELEGPA